MFSLDCSIKQYQRCSVILVVAPKTINGINVSETLLTFNLILHFFQSAILFNVLILLSRSQVNFCLQNIYFTHTFNIILVNHAYTKFVLQYTGH